MPRSGTSGSYGKFYFWILRIFYMDFQSGCTSLQSHEQGVRSPFVHVFSSTPFGLSIFAILINPQRCFITHFPNCYRSWTLWEVVLRCFCFFHWELCYIPRLFFNGAIRSVDFLVLEFWILTFCQSLPSGLFLCSALQLHFPSFPLY